MKNNVIKATLVGILLFSTASIYAYPFPNFTTTNWFSMVKTWGNKTVSKKINCVYSNEIIVTVVKCDEPIVDNTAKKKAVLTASTRN